MSEKTVYINGREYSFSQDETILDICNRNNIFIPTLCHLKGTTPTGACRLYRATQPTNATRLLTAKKD